MKRALEHLPLSTLNQKFNRLNVEVKKNRNNGH